MFMNDVIEDVELQVQRYTIVGNDSSFKAYTKDSHYLHSSSTNQGKQSLEDSVLRVTLKDDMKKQTGQNQSDDKQDDGRQ